MRVGIVLLEEQAEDAESGCQCLSQDAEIYNRIKRLLFTMPKMFILSFE